MGGDGGVGEGVSFFLRAFWFCLLGGGMVRFGNDM